MIVLSTLAASMCFRLSSGPVTLNFDPSRNMQSECAPMAAMLGVNAIAAPVFDKSATAVAAVAVVGSIQFLPAKPETRLIKALRDCAGQISRRLGHVRN